jgi:hypothetical protein
MRNATVTLIALIALALLAVAVTAGQPLSTQARSAALITVSGTVTGPGGAVPNVWIGIGSPQSWRETTTNASGFYSVAIPTDGQLWFSVRPDIATRLAQVNHSRSGVTTNITQNFTVAAGLCKSAYRQRRHAGHRRHLD